MAEQRLKEKVVHVINHGIELDHEFSKRIISYGLLVSQCIDVAMPELHIAAALLIAINIIWVWE